MFEILLYELPTTLSSIIWIYNHADIVSRSIDRAEIVLNSFEETGD